MKVFLDTNVVIDFCAKREKFFSSAAKIIDLGISGDIDLAVSSLTFINVAYIMRKGYDKEVVMDKLDELASLFEITQIDGDTIHQSIEKRSKDFEDCVQCFSAMTANSDLIVTRNVNDFKDLPLPVMTPDDFIAACQKSTTEDNN